MRLVSTSAVIAAALLASPNVGGLPVNANSPRVGETDSPSSPSMGSAHFAFKHGKGRPGTVHSRKLVHEPELEEQDATGHLPSAIEGLGLGCDLPENEVTNYASLPADDSLNDLTRPLHSIGKGIAGGADNLVPGSIQRGVPNYPNIGGLTDGIPDIFGSGTGLDDLNNINSRLPAAGSLKDLPLISNGQGDSTIPSHVPIDSLFPGGFRDGPNTPFSPRPGSGLRGANGGSGGAPPVPVNYPFYGQGSIPDEALTRYKAAGHKFDQQIADASAGAPSYRYYDPNVDLVKADDGGEPKQAIDGEKPAHSTNSEPHHPRPTSTSEDAEHKHRTNALGPLPEDGILPVRHSKPHATSHVQEQATSTAPTADMPASTTTAPVDSQRTDGTASSEMPAQTSSTVYEEPTGEETEAQQAVPKDADKDAQPSGQASTASSTATVGTKQMTVSSSATEVTPTGSSPPPISTAEPVSETVASTMTSEAMAKPTSDTSEVI